MLTPIGISVRYASIDHTLSQSISGVKDQIHRLRTESPDLKMDSPERSMYQMRDNKTRKREELAKIILNKLKR